EAEAARMPDLEAAARTADEVAIAMAHDHERMAEAINRYRGESQQAELDRTRWRDRVEDLRRRFDEVGADVAALERAAGDQAARVEAAEGEATAVAQALPARSAAAESARRKLEDLQGEAPEEEAEMAEGTKKLVALDEARIDARLKAGTLEGNLGLLTREAELLQARLDEIRVRMPDGVAPEEIPGGKTREKEMRTLERRLEEIGPVNALAESECRELEERFETLKTQLDDIAAAREDLEELIAKLREEEEARYEAVFGAVAANFHEYFSQLAPGGRATL